ncbi:MAG: hypothetical protein AAB503_02550 [Patescibacteria group bacterium]
MQKFLRHLNPWLIKKGQAPLEIVPAKVGLRPPKGDLPLTGQATISFVLLISGVILQIAIAGSIVTYFLSSSRFNERLIARSFIAAETGIRDAQVQISRNGNFVESGTKTYSISVGSDTSEISVVRSTDNPNSIYVYTITSIGTAFSRKKKLVGVITVHQTTGLLEFKSISEQDVN